MLTTPVPAIDVHTHLFPPRLAAAVRRALTEMYGWSFPLPDDPDAFAAFERSKNIERFCILPYAHKPGMARSLNGWVAETADRLPGAIPFACVHQDDDDPVAILRDAFEAGAKGIKLHHQVQAVAPADPRLFGVYELMLERGMPILAHAGRGPTDHPATGAVRFRELMDRYPELTVIVAHMGAPEIEEFVAMLGDYPNLHLDTSGMWSVSLAGRVTEGNADRIVWGSDAPNIGFDFDRTIALVTDLGLGEAATEAIFRGNAARLLGIA